MFLLTVPKTLASDKARIAADMVDHLAAELTADTARNRLIWWVYFPGRG